MRRQRPLWASWFFVTLLLLIGCNLDSQTAVVSGTVTVDGNLAKEGTINFIPADGKGRTAGATIKDGQYSAKVPVGTMKVAISVPKPGGIIKKLYDKPDSPERIVRGELLPPKYSSMEETELTLEVGPGEVEKNFDLKSQ